MKSYPTFNSFASSFSSYVFSLTQVCHLTDSVLWVLFVQSGGKVPFEGLKTEEKQ